MADLPSLVEVVGQFTSQVARKLREQRSVAGAVHVFIATSPYGKNDHQHTPSATLPLSHPSADTRILISEALRALRSVHRGGFNYAKAGVMLVDLQPLAKHRATPDLFASEETPESKQGSSYGLMSALDALNQRFGHNAISVASVAQRAAPSAHASRQERRSPRYTTRLEDLVTARA